ncbi:MAG: M10 family metallopeptidase [Methylobacterium frigidaeris]
MTSPYADASGPSNAAGPGSSDPLQDSALIDQVFRNGRYEFSGNQDIDAILIGSKWTLPTLTYSFPTSGDVYAGSGYAAGTQPDFQTPFNAQQQAAARTALSLVASYTTLAFSEITETDQDHADLRLSQTGSALTPTATGQFPSDVAPNAGDIWFGTTGQPYYDTPASGNWGNATMMHEIGHALGLKHGQDDYTTEDLQSFLGPSSDGGPRYGSAALPGEHDGQDWSLMTYRRAPGIPTEAGLSDHLSEPQTYMQNDIAALQYLYGANFTSHGGDTVYRWSQTTGEMSIDGVGQGAPVVNRIRMTVWDGNGNDTYDLSNYTSNLRVDLQPGHFSTFDGDQLARETSRDSSVSYSHGNVANALLYQGDTRSLIENAVGGSGSDTIYGNVAGNRLAGGDGGDVLSGHEGQDLLQGDGGNDTLFGGSGGDSLAGGDGADLMFGDGDDDLINAGAGNDRGIGGSGNDQVFGEDGRDLVQGGDNDDFVSGGWGNDTVLGEAGGDLLFGDDDDDLVDGNDGDDLVYGGTGTDTVFGSAGNDRVYGEQGNDFIGTGSGNDVGSGGDGNDEVHGEEGDDLLFGDDGNDGVYGEAGDDTVRGGTGSDYLTGDAGKDGVFGEDGDDRQFGGDDDDYLSGGSGDDGLDGGAGSDLLFGNAGNDLLTGGAGSDIFAFGAGDGLDRILDFVLGGSEADVIAFNGGAFADFAAVQAASRQDGADVLIAYGAGDGITLQGVQLGTLSAANFTFV